jgi:hypothetical protein
MVVNSADFNSPVILTSVELFKLTTLARTVANSAALPATPIQGLIRYITNLNYYYEYDEYSTATVDNLTVLTATTGRWLRVGAISTYITDTTATDGCDQDVRTPNLIVNAPSYTCDGSKGDGVTFWLRNEFSTIISSGTRISCTVRLFEEDKSQLFDSLLILELLGYVNLITGVLDASVSSGEVTYQPRSQWLTLPEDLDIGYAAVVRVSPKFTITDLDNNVPYLANLTTYVTFAPTSGIYTPGVFGNLIYNEYDKWRIYSDVGLSVIKSKGSGIVNNYELNDISAETITGLSSNTANQYIFLTSNGTSFASTTSSFVSAVKRCVVSTVNGIGTPVSYGSFALNNTKKLSVTVNYPTSVRSNYPDALIAGSSKGKFNATNVVIYIKNSSNAVFVTEVNITPSASNDVYVLNYSDFTSSTLATPSSNYGLYTPLSVTTSTPSNSSTFPTDSYEVFVAFKYTGVVTVIDHSVSELYEITSNLSELFSTSATVWYSDNGVPSSLIGEDGSYYLNYDNANIYKKVNDTWSLDGNISVISPSFTTIAVSGQSNVVADQTNDSLTLVAGTGITLTTNATTDAITITGTSVTNTFSTITVAGQSDIVADSASDTLTIAAGSGITLTTNSTTDTLTITGTAVSNTFTTIAVSGQSDVVADSASDTLTIAAGSGITLTTNSTTDTLTITGTAVSNTFTTIAVSGQSDVVADSASDTITLVAGTGMTITTNTTTDTITFESSGVNVDVTRTSTMSNSIGTGSKTFTYTASSNLGWLVSTRLRAAYDVSNYMEGVVTAVSSTSVTITSDNAVGSGTYTSWNITIAGDKGSTGSAGSLNAASGFILTPVGSPITTSTNEVGFYVDSTDNLFKTRDVNNGTVRTLASLNRVQAFTQTQYATPVINNSATGTVTLDGSASNVFILTLTGNLTLTMNNIQVGATYIIYLIQDATGSRTITLNAIFKRLTGDTTTVNTTANKVNMLTGVARSSSAITLAPISVEV